MARLGLDQRINGIIQRSSGRTEQHQEFCKNVAPPIPVFITISMGSSTRKKITIKDCKLIAQTEALVWFLIQEAVKLELQAAADVSKKGCYVLRGMAIPKRYAGIISGRVHKAIYFSPELILIIITRFFYFRDLRCGRILSPRNRIAFLTGYGTELICSALRQR